MKFALTFVVMAFAIIVTPIAAIWDNAHHIFANGTNAVSYCRRCNITDRTNFETCHQGRVDAVNASLTQLEHDLFAAGNNITARQLLRQAFWCGTIRDHIRTMGSCIPVCVLTLKVDTEGDVGEFIRKPAVDYCMMAQNRTVTRLVANNTFANLEDVLNYYGCPANCDDLVNQGLQPNIDAYEAETTEPVTPIKDSLTGSGSSSSNVIMVGTLMAVVTVIVDVLVL